MPNPCRVFRVLAIDDDDDDQLVLARWARRAPVPPQIKTLSAAEEAMDYLEAQAGSSEMPHVIFCDIKMPGMDGFEFLKWLRGSRHKHIPIVMRSASPVNSDVAKAYQLGANSYVVKRVGLEANEVKMNDLVHYWRDIAEVPGR